MCNDGRLAAFGQRVHDLGPDTGVIRFYLAPRVYLATRDTLAWIYVCVVGRTPSSDPERARVPRQLSGWGRRTHTFTGIHARGGFVDLMTARG